MKTERMKTLFLTIQHHSVNSCSYCVAHDLSGQAHFHGTLSNSGQVGVSQLVTDHEINFRFSPCIFKVNHIYWPTNAFNCIKLKG